MSGRGDMGSILKNEASRENLFSKWRRAREKLQEAENAIAELQSTLHNKTKV